MIPFTFLFWRYAIISALVSISSGSPLWTGPSIRGRCSFCLYRDGSMERIFRSDFWKKKTALPVSLKSHRSTEFQPETLLSIVFCHFWLDSVTKPLCSSTKGQGHKKVLTVEKKDCLKKSLALWLCSEFWNLFPLPIICPLKSHWCQGDGQRIQQL